MIATPQSLTLKRAYSSGGCIGFGLLGLHYLEICETQNPPRGVCTENLIRILLRDSDPDTAIPLPGSPAEW